jgi:hypothetical protein
LKKSRRIERFLLWVRAARSPYWASRKLFGPPGADRRFEVLEAQVEEVADELVEAAFVVAV